MMSKIYFKLGWIMLFVGCLTACGSNSTPPKQIEKEEVLIKTDSLLIEKQTGYEGLLKEFKSISFDTLKVSYSYEEKNNPFFGKELTLKEAKSLPIGFTENYFGKVSGVYACCQFSIDSNRVGLITRIPAEYESTSIVLLIFDRKKNKILNEYYHLAASTGDAGEVYVRTSWLFKNKKNQFH
jgi:hypothetical protein